MYRYTLYVSERKDPDNGKRTVYGIAVHEAGEQIAVIPDIDTDPDRLQRLVDLCNRRQLSPTHLKDVAEDYITEKHSGF